jgi:Fibronectin type III domain
MKQLIFLLTLFTVTLFGVSCDKNLCELPKPTNVTISAITDKTAKVTWSAVAGAFDYNLVVTDKGGTSVVYTKSGTTATEEIISGLTAGKNYTVKIAARCNKTQLSTNFATNDFTSADICDKPAVTNLTVLATPTTAKVDFTPLAGHTTGYFIKIYEKNPKKAVDSINIDKPPHTFLKLKPGTAYTVEVFTKCSTGVSANRASNDFITPTIIDDDIVTLTKDPKFINCTPTGSLSTNVSVIELKDNSGALKNGVHWITINNNVFKINNWYDNGVMQFSYKADACSNTKDLIKNGNTLSDGTNIDFDIYGDRIAITNPSAVAINVVSVRW